MPTSTTDNFDAASSFCEYKVTPLVLVVEDDQITSKLLKKYLQRDGMDYHGVGSGIEALKFLDEGRLPDLILSDISMPQMDGLEFCRRLRQSELLREIPLIFFTARSDNVTLNRAFEVGANDFVRKPFKKDEVLNRSQRLIKEYHRKQLAKQRIQSLDNANQNKSKFLGVASHDLRNPLVSIRGISQFLESEKFGTLNEGQKEMVTTIIEASNSMLALVEDLLEVSKFDSHQVQLNRETISLNDIAKQALNLHSQMAKQKDIELVLIEANKPANVNIDPKLFSRVVDNLVTNAIKFAQRGTRAFIVVDSFADKASLAIEDEGPGFTEEDFNKLFKEFSRTSNMPTGGESSSGIGLYMSKQLVTRLGGDIIAENRSPCGARFITTFNRID